MAFNPTAQNVNNFDNDNTYVGQNSLDHNTEFKELLVSLTMYMMDTFNIVQPKSLDIPPSDDVITYFRGLNNMLKSAIATEKDEAIKNVMSEISASVKRCLFRLKLDEIYVGD